MIKIDTVIFDLDGTLIDSKEDIISAVNYTLKTLGNDPKPAREITPFIGTGSKDLIKKSLGKANNGRKAEKAHSIFVDYFRKHSYDKTVLFPHVKEVLDYLSNKNLFILTNRSKNLAKEALNHFRIYKYFKDIDGGDSDKCRKPSACPVNKFFAIHKIDKTKSMIVGDMDIDIKTGKAAGIYSCGFTGGIGKRKDIEEVNPDYLIDDLLELKNIITGGKDG
ncbi:MAG: HAD family hydrolase [Candidatus Omnitrophica bacterium]|nr:HAD family hydrolase [Candidatus Omnitrophota bacterium]MCF7876787.1 HAD family hydrolase [Candidatus Omnitrophota bacterium]MCF7878233.1 HAD family hydrolase [Candidatus Omnitrophota bacterium]